MSSSVGAAAKFVFLAFFGSFVVFGFLMVMISVVGLSWFDYGVNWKCVIF